MFERLIVPMAAPDTTDPVFPVTSSQAMQGQTRFVKLQVTRVAQIDDLDPPDRRDFFARAKIAGQSLPVRRDPQLRQLRVQDAQRPVHVHQGRSQDGRVRGAGDDACTVEIRTSSRRGAGTDDDVYLRIGPNLRFPLDKRLYDDFERGDRDTYSVPIDDAVLAGLNVGDITRVQIEKSPDGVAGGWKLRRTSACGSTAGRLVHAPDRPLARRRPPHVARPDIRYQRRRAGRGCRCSSSFWELDAAIRGDDNHTDTNVYDRRKDNGLVYQSKTHRDGGHRRREPPEGPARRQRAPPRFRYRITAPRTQVLSRIAPKPQPPPEDGQ